MYERLIGMQHAELAQFLHSNALYILLPTPAHNPQSPQSGLGLSAATAIVRLLPERLFVQCSAAHLAVEPRTERLHKCRTPFVDRHLARGVVQDTEIRAEYGNIWNCCGHSAVPRTKLYT